MKSLDVKIPKKFLTYANCTSGRKYIAIYYSCSNASWTDGRSSATFNYYCLYKILLHNPYMMIALSRAGVNEYDLGSDDYPPDDYLIIDRTDYSVYVINADKGHQLLTDNDRNPIISERPNIPPVTPSSMGMFEMFSIAPVYLKEFADELTRYFNEKMTKQWFETLSDDEIRVLAMNFNWKK